MALVNPGVYPVLHGAIRAPGSVRLPFRYRWRFGLDPARLVADGSAALEVELARLRAAHPFGGGSTVPGLSTGLADLVEDHRADRAAAAATVAVALVGPLAAMLGMLAHRRHRDASRPAGGAGGSPGPAAAARARCLAQRPGYVEVLVVALPAALAGGLAAGYVVSGGITTAGVGPSLLIGAAAVAFAGPRRGLRGSSRAGRSAGRPGPA